MSRTVYVNGEYLPEEDAKISVFDRGFLFADGVYEVSSVIEGKLIDNSAHLARLQRSLDEIEMALPCAIEEIEAIQKEMLLRNELVEGMLYLQVSRQAADRDFYFKPDSKSSLVMFTQVMNLVNNPVAEKGISVISVPDLRWERRDIKTLQLLYPSLAKTEAKNKGADDAWMVENGFVTEGSSNNAWIILQDGTIVTRHLSNEILHGITRRSILKFAAERQLKIEERPFTIEEAKHAREAFVSSATTFVMPVVSIDGIPVSDGKPGEMTKQLRSIYLEEAKAL
ncbi:MAG: D-amino-acid transaminase [Salaquimonas sp.]